MQICSINIFINPLIKNKMTLKTALMYTGVIVAGIIIAELAKPAINKMLGRA